MAQIYVVAGLGFGDEGKGGIVDFLCREYKAFMVVRYNGGAQAGHNVIDPDGRHHTFSQFGAGTFAGAGTYLSRFMLVNPIFMMAEAKHLKQLGFNPYRSCYIEGPALVTTPFQVATNRLRELQRGLSRHGSCGMGIGETVLDNQCHPELSISVEELEMAVLRPSKLREKLHQIQLVKKEEALEFLAGKTSPEIQRELYILENPEEVDRCLTYYQEWAPLVDIVRPDFLNRILGMRDAVVFEGSQGVLLDEDYGFHPHTTWAKTTFQNALELLKGHPAKFMGVLRTFATRHGRGPFPTEDPKLQFPDPYNTHGDWQQSFRVGHFDLVLAKYAQALTHCDELVLTHAEKNCDRLCVAYQSPLGQMCTELPRPRDLEDNERRTNWLMTMKPVYETIDSQVHRYRRIEAELGIPLTLVSEGPSARDKSWRR